MSALNQLAVAAWNAVMRTILRHSQAVQKRVR